MKIGQSLKIKGESYIIVEEFLDSFLAVDEFLTNYKRIPKLVRIK